MKSESYPRVFVLAAFVVAVAAAVYALRLIYDPVIRPILSVVPPFAIAFVIAFLLDPVVDWFERRRMSRGLGVAVVGLSFLIVFGLVGFLVVPRVAEQAAALAENSQEYAQGAQDAINEVLEGHKSLLQRLHLPTTTGEWSKRYSAQLENVAQASLGFVATALSSMASKFLWIVIIPISTLLLLKDLDYLKAKTVHLTPEHRREGLVTLSSAVGGVFGKYVRGMISVAILYSVVAAIVLSALGLPYALVIGALSGLFYLIPIVGNIFIVLMVGITAVVQPSFSLGYTGLLCLVMLVLSMVVFDQLIFPRVVGKSVGVHPVLMLFSLALGAQLFGVVGMLLAVPVVASMQVAIGQVYPNIYDDLRVSMTGKATKQN
ncbi:MAG: AI-2E family transporter [Armatimonadetes bacterium]|nr:AI-2E family transporter [Armatimonadota bacterium]